MHILIANDDGIRAPGLLALCEAARKAGHRVTVFAPDGQRSAASHSISIAANLHVQRMELNGFEAYAVDGTPADCVRLGLYLNRKDLPDCVLAGVNNGANRGAAILYSGTVGAAMEAALCGVPGVAVSLCSRLNYGYETAAWLGVRTAQWALAHPLPMGEIYNLNVPFGADVRGIRPATVSNEFICAPAYLGDAETGYRMAEGRDTVSETDANSDLCVTRAGYAALSVLSWNLLAGTALADLEDLNAGVWQR